MLAGDHQPQKAKPVAETVEPTPASSYPMPTHASPKSNKIQTPDNSKCQEKDTSSFCDVAAAQQAVSLSSGKGPQTYPHYVSKVSCSQTSNTWVILCVCGRQFVWEHLKVDPGISQLAADSLTVTTAALKMAVGFCAGVSRTPPKISTGVRPGVSEPHDWTQVMPAVARTTPPPQSSDSLLNTLVEITLSECGHKVATAEVDVFTMALGFDRPELAQSPSPEPVVFPSKHALPGLWQLRGPRRGLPTLRSAQRAPAEAPTTVLPDPLDGTLCCIVSSSLRAGDLVTARKRVLISLRPEPCRCPALVTVSLSAEVAAGALAVHSAPAACRRSLRTVQACIQSDPIDSWTTQVSPASHWTLPPLVPAPALQTRRLCVRAKVYGLEPSDIPANFLEEMNKSLSCYGTNIVSIGVRSACIEFIIDVCCQVEEGTGARSAAPAVSALHGGPSAARRWGAAAGEAAPAADQAAAGGTGGANQGAPQPLHRAELKPVDWLQLVMQHLPQAVLDAQTPSPSG